MSPSRDRGLELRIVQSREELSAAWDVLGAAYDPPLRERVGDYEAYVDKVSRSAVTILCIEGCSPCSAESPSMRTMRTPGLRS